MLEIVGNAEYVVIETEVQPMLAFTDETVLTNNNNRVEIIAKHNEKQSDNSSKKEIQLFWQNISYSVNENRNKNFFGFDFGRVTKTRKIIENLSGSIVSGRLTAILGPNGAGKSTLMDCLAGKRKSGLSGDIFVTYKGHKRDLKFAYYSQKDFLIDLLTVEECLIYASELKHCRQKSRITDVLTRSMKAEQNGFVSIPNKLVSNKNFHRMKAEKIINDLHLQKCAKTQVCYCSGGQRRRLSIALELIFSPTILLLDEPTSGLDSVSTLQCVELLKRLSQNSAKPMIIALVIHQPTARLLSYFDNLYIVSSTGQSIYDGPTTLLVERLSKFNLDCPQFHNPSDFALEIASGDYGFAAIELLADFQRNSYEEYPINDENRIKMSKVIQKTQKHSTVDQMMTTWVLTKRCLRMNLRDPKQYFLQFSSVLMMLILIYVIHWEYKIGTNDGCLRRPDVEYVKNLHIFDILNPKTSPYPNWAFIFYSLLFMVFTAMLPTLLAFPLDVYIFTKEHSNGWYSMSSYYVAKNLADLPPNFIFPLMYCVGSYILTQQIMEFWRFVGFLTIMIILSILTQGLAFLVSAIFVNNITASTVIGAIINIPLVLFAGLLIKIQSFPELFQPFTYLSYYRLTFESVMVIIYGFDRCQTIEPLTVQNMKRDFGDHIIPMAKCVYDYDTDLVDNVTLAVDYFNGMIDRSYSFALNAFEYHESNLLINIFILIIYAVVIRILAYIVLVFRIKIK